MAFTRTAAVDPDDGPGSERRLVPPCCIDVDACVTAASGLLQKPRKSKINIRDRRKDLSPHPLRRQSRCVRDAAGRRRDVQPETTPETKDAKERTFALDIRYPQAMRDQS